MVGGDGVVERGRKGIFGSEPVIDRQHAGARRRCDTPNEVAVKRRRAVDETTAVKMQDMAILFRRRGGYAVRPSATGIRADCLGVR
jgi:hypothetical protein